MWCHWSSHLSLFSLLVVLSSCCAFCAPQQNNNHTIICLCTTWAFFTRTPLVYQKGFLKYLASSIRPAAVYLHGGPAAGCNPLRAHRFFDPSFYKIVTFDQRGCGRSEPTAGVDMDAAMTENNTWTIVEDIEKLRKREALLDWRIASLIPPWWSLWCWGAFSCFERRHEFWLFECGGASTIYPDKFEKYVSIIPENERHQMIEVYYIL